MAINAEETGSRAMKANQPIITKDVIDATELTTGILTGPCKPPYMCDFVWSVQVIDTSGNELANSEPAAFKILVPIRQGGSK